MYKGSKTICSRWSGYAQLKCIHKSHVIWFLDFTCSVCFNTLLQGQIMCNGTNSACFWRGLSFCLSSSPMRQKLESNGVQRECERACSNSYNSNLGYWNISWLWSRWRSLKENILRGETWNGLGTKDLSRQQTAWERLKVTNGKARTKCFHNNI